MVNTYIQSAYTLRIITCSQTHAIQLVADIPFRYSNALTVIVTNTKKKNETAHHAVRGI